MNINQAFQYLIKYTDIKTAKLILNKKKLNFISLIYISLLLKKGIPVSKILKEKYFYGLKFYTNKYTLDPRCDSETLVEAVLNIYKDKDISVLDLGTGTSCLISSILYYNKNAKGMAVDKSYLAIKVARKNLNYLKLSDRCILKKQDFTKCNFPKFDVIISNPPYITYNDENLDKSAFFDPKIALYAKNNGLYFYHILAKKAKNWLNSKGALFIEIGFNQKEQVERIFNDNSWILENIYYDLSNIPRVLHLKYKN